MHTAGRSLRLIALLTDIGIQVYCDVLFICTPLSDDDFIRCYPADDDQLLFFYKAFYGTETEYSILPR